MPAWIPSDQNVLLMGSDTFWFGRPEQLTIITRGHVRQPYTAVVGGRAKTSGSFSDVLMPPPSGYLARLWLRYDHEAAAFERLAVHA